MLFVILVFKWSKRNGILFLQNKAKLVTYVVASGLTYGAEEHIFHYLFKVSLSLYMILQRG